MAKQQTLTNKTVNGNGANLGFEAKLWAAADKMRNNMDAGQESNQSTWALKFLGYSVMLRREYVKY